MAKATTKTGATIAPGDLFGGIAKPAEATAKKSKIPLAEVTQEIKDKVDAYIQTKAEYRQKEQELADLEAAIIGYVRPQQDNLAFKGQFTKSLVVKGDDGDITMVTSDKFSALKETDVIDAMKAFLGKDFEATWPTKRTITLKKEAADNAQLIAKFFKAIEAAGLQPGEVFDVTDTRVAVDGLDEKQYVLCGNQTRLDTFRTIAKQNKPALK